MKDSSAKNGNSKNIIHKENTVNNNNDDDKYDNWFINQYKNSVLENEEILYMNILSHQEIIDEYQKLKEKHKSEVEYPNVTNTNLFRTFRNEKEFNSLPERTKILRSKMLISQTLTSYNEIIENNYKSFLSKIEKQYKSLLQPLEYDEYDEYSDDNNKQLENITLNYNNKIKTKTDAFLNIESLLPDEILNQTTNYNNLLKIISTGQLKDDDITESIKYTVLNKDLSNKSILNEYALNFEDQRINNEIKTHIFDAVENNTINQFVISNCNNKQKDIEIIRKGLPNVTKIVFDGIDDPRPYFEVIEGQYIPKIQKIYFNNCIVYDSKMSIFDFKRIIEKITKLVFKDSKIIIPSNIIGILFPSITILKIEKAELVDSEFKTIINNIILFSKMKDQLKLLSFEGNNLTNIIFPPLPNSETVIIFPLLEELNLKTNKIYSLTIGSKIFPRLQLLDITKNMIRKLVDLSIPWQFEYKRKNEIMLKDNYNNNKINKEEPKTPRLILTCRNIFMTEKENIKKQKKYLEAICEEYDRKTKCISFAGLYNSKNHNQLTLIKLNPTAFYHLKELDLSFCGLNNESINQFFTNNPLITQLKKLILKGNYLDINFFGDYYSNNNENNSVLYYNNLEYLSLSNNLIKDEEFNEVIHFIKLNKNLTCINLKYNPFGLNYTAKEISIKLNLEENGEINHSNIRNSTKLKKDFIDLYKEVNLLNRGVLIDFTTEDKIISHKRFDRKTKKVIIKRK